MTIKGVRECLARLIGIPMIVNDNMKHSKKYNERFDRYMASKKKRLLLLYLASAVFVIFAFGLMYPRNEIYAWFSVILIIPAYYQAIKTAKAAKEYARRGGK